jgi:hypothetical protein
VLVGTAVVAGTAVDADRAAGRAAGIAEYTAVKDMNMVQVDGIVPEEEEGALLDFETAWMVHCWEQYLPEHSEHVV